MVTRSTRRLPEYLGQGAGFPPTFRARPRCGAPGAHSLQKWTVGGPRILFGWLVTSRVGSKLEVSLFSSHVGPMLGPSWIQKSHKNQS